jgi:nicotinate-nucleotide adenylyltransferase
MPMCVALFGGSFNPPHAGHAQVVLHLLHAGFDEVWVIPASTHPFGKELAPFSDREAMLRMALSGFGGRARICTVESELPAPSRTFDTVVELLRRHPGHDFTLALGEDQRPDLPRWHRIDELGALVPFFFVGRGPWNPGDAELRLPDISSSELRRRFAAGEAPRGLMHTRVCDFILERGLYGARPAAPGTPVSLPRCAVIGLGRVGGAWCATLRRAGLAPAWGADPDPDRRSLAARDRIPVFPDWQEALRRDPEVDFLLFCTPDSWRPTASAEVWPAKPPACLHTGGMHRPREVFAGLGLPPERLGILHPVRAVAQPGAELDGEWFSFSGEPGLRDLLAPLAAFLRLRLVPVPDTLRPAFHAACALVANGSQVLEQDGAELFGRIGIRAEDARGLVGQLVRRSLESWESDGAGGFTGPWARGDEVVAATHAEALSRLSPGVEPLYQALKKASARLRAPDPGGADGLDSETGNLPEKP